MRAKVAKLLRRVGEKQKVSHQRMRRMRRQWDRTPRSERAARRAERVAMLKEKPRG